MKAEDDSRNEALLFAAPVAILLAGLVLLPLAMAFWQSLHQETAFLPRAFVFLDNYVALIRSASFWQSLGFTLLFLSVSVPIETFFGIIFALTLHACRFRGLLQAVILLPWALPLVVAGRIWELIFDYQVGAANVLLRAVGVEPMNWFGTPGLAFSTLVFADVWKTTPFVAIILYAGLKTIPADLFAQARIDRAGLIDRFRRITLPLLLPSIVVAILFRAIDAIRVFDIVYVLTEGGPGGSTTPLSLHAYRFFLSSDFGAGSASSMALFLVTFVLCLLFLAVTRRQWKTS